MVEVNTTINEGSDIDEDLKQDFTSYRVILHKTCEDPYVKGLSKTLNRISKVVDKEIYEKVKEQIQNE